MAKAQTSGSYIGRFAPSPSGPLHDGSLVAAMASYLDARAHQGIWRLRIEDIDTPRVEPGVDHFILRQLRTLGMHWDGEPIWQSGRLPLYQTAFEALCARHLVYGCACTRQDLTPGPYPGTCSAGLAPGKFPRSWRVRVPEGIEYFVDRWAGPQQQNVRDEVGDFIIKRADGLWAYQLAAVVDDGAQGITHIVRGADLLDSSARQRVLARHLGLGCAELMHVPLLYDDNGYKMSKQNHAAALDLSRPLETLGRAWRALGFEALRITSIEAFWQAAVPLWSHRFRRP